MMDVTSCGSMAGSACAALHAVGPCICSWFVWTSAPVRSTTEERWLKKYQCTDDCACIGPSIYCIRPSMHPVGKGQANR